MKKWTIFYEYEFGGEKRYQAVLFDDEKQKHYLGGSGGTLEHLLYETKADAEAWKQKAKKDLNSLKSKRSRLVVERFKLVPLTL